MRLSLEKGLSLEEEKENRLKKLTYARDVVGWTADKEGNVFNKKGRIIGYLVKTGKNAGYLESTYRIKKKRYKVRLHQFVYWYFTAEVVEQIDHKSKIGRDVFPFGRNDNRLENLRPATNSENSQNKNAKGYYLNKKNKKWYARIVVNGETISLNGFHTEEEAHQAYLEAKKIYHII